MLSFIMCAYDMCAYDAAGRFAIWTGHKACRSRDRVMSFEQSGWDVFSFSSVSPSFTLSKVSTDVCTEPFLAWNRSDTFADNCPIVTACCILMKAAYLFRLHLLKRRATGFVCILLPHGLMLPFLIFSWQRKWIRQKRDIRRPIHPIRSTEAYLPKSTLLRLSNSFR